MRRRFPPGRFITGNPPHTDSSVGAFCKPISASGQPDPKFGGVWKKFPRENPNRVSETIEGEIVYVNPLAIACDLHNADPNVSLNDPSDKPGRGAGRNCSVSTKE
jgi:hypothetical protein